MTAMRSTTVVLALTSAWAGDLRSIMPALLTQRLLGMELWQYLALAGVVAISVAARKVIRLIVFNRVRKLAEALGHHWMMRLVDLIASPGATLVMAALLWASFPALDLPDGVYHPLSELVGVLIAIAISWAAYLAVDVVGDRLAERAAATDSRLDDQLVPLLRKSLKALAVAAGGVLVLQNLEVDVGSLLAGLGIGGLAFALAAKDTLANFFGSFMIFVDRPFQIGDWIVVGPTEGIVEEVGFRSTRVRTFYNSLVTVPNAVFTETHIDNYGARQYRRTSVTLNLTYDTSADKVQAFVEGVRAIIEANPTTRKDYYEVHMSGFGAHSLNVMLYFFFRVDSWSAELRERHNVYLEILRLAQKLEVRFAFPTQTLHVESQAPPQEHPAPKAMSRDQLQSLVRSFGPGGRHSQPEAPMLAPPNN